MSDLKQICETINSFPKGEYLTGEFPPNGDYDNYLTTDQLQDLTAKLATAVEALEHYGNPDTYVEGFHKFGCDAPNIASDALKQIGEQR